MIKNVTLAAAIAIAASPAFAKEEAEVMHWWTSGGESAAIKVLADAYEADGGTWQDSAVAGGSNARSAAINRMIGGSPTTAALFNTSQQYHEMIAEDMLNNIDAVAKANNWDQILPKPTLDAIKVNGHFYAAPVNIHMPGWFWYSKEAFDKAGIEQEPQTPEELFSALDKLKEAGYIPLALGGQNWQENLLFATVLSNIGGKQLYLDALGKRDAETLNSDEFKTVVDTFLKLKPYVDTGSPGRNWNDTTSLVINDKAGIQVMGDWAKGEFTQANKIPGQDYGCFPGLGDDSLYIVGGDVFVFPKTDDKDQIAAQQSLVESMLKPATQVEFNNLKGSVPVRTDIDVSSMDICAQKGAAILKVADRQIPDGSMLMEEYLYGSLKDAVTEVWNSPNITTAQAVTIFERALRD
ncbi:sugar ABC transporter substrate-binding protein [Vibrio sp. 10N.286.49.C2]|uniref:ABC transporter substrate-binding protein n=1 Tax=unclassified Vibrio TaxID=2614977 RepID=UPI000C8594EE|nr:MULTISPECIES: ABC transporter substrate-binding protein [unclassified Vibrio]PMH38204.1 sugar ABC transporter substrate-binding protein [Vibrio sp. 10N.286.49.C2]PMH53589.1 sugar ABC transporter substrate-binding protein [Vibrio sp. 10N.286.49.B1]